jgi:hypothetical protein
LETNLEVEHPIEATTKRILYVSIIIHDPVNIFSSQVPVSLFIRIKTNLLSNIKYDAMTKYFSTPNYPHLFYESYQNLHQRLQVQLNF